MATAIKAPPLAEGEKERACAGILLMLGAALIFAFLGVFIKMMDPRFRLWDIAAYRFWGGVIGLLIAFGWRENFLRPENPRLMLARGVAGGLTFICLVAAIRTIPFSTAMVLFYSFPAFAAFFSSRLFGEKASGKEYLCIGLTVAGVAVLFDYAFDGGFAGQLLGVMAGLLAGLATCLVRKLRENNGPAIIYFHMCLWGGLMTLPFFLDGPRFPAKGVEWLLVAGIVLTSTVAQLLMTTGFKYCKSWQGGVFMTSEVLFAMVLGVALFSEQISWRFFVGGSMVVASAFLIQVGNKRRQA